MTNDDTYLNLPVISEEHPLAGLRFGAHKNFLQNPLYKQQTEIIESLGGTVITFEPVKINTEGFGTLLSGDMRVDLPAYLEQYASENITVRSIAEIVDYNNKDREVRVPYGQETFEEMAQMELTAEELATVRERLQSEGKRYFETPMNAYNLDFILSIDNFEASYAAWPISVCHSTHGLYRERRSHRSYFRGPLVEDHKLLSVSYLFEQFTASDNSRRRTCNGY